MSGTNYEFVVDVSKAVNWTLYDSLSEAVDRALYVNVDVSKAVVQAVYRAVYRAVGGVVSDAVMRAVKEDSEHPAPQDFLREARL